MAKAKTTVAATGKGDDNGKAESKAERFERLAIDRMDKTISRLRQIAALGNRATYDYTEEQADHIVAALTVELSKIQAAFKGQVFRSTGFSFPKD